MELTLIRNATLVLDYAGHRILIDPYFAPKHSLPSFTGKSPNPMVDLPFPPEKILDGVELLLVSHLHTDHFDTVAQEFIDKTLPLVCQPGDEEKIQSKGFQEVFPLQDSVEWNGIYITRTDGHHGLGEVEKLMGKVCGFVLQAEGEPTVYWAGDTVLCAEVEEAITHFQPHVIIIHACGAKWKLDNGDQPLIVMDAEQAMQVCRLAPDSQVIATHMEALDHATVSRADLSEEARLEGLISQQFDIPEDGETLTLF